MCTPFRGEELCVFAASGTFGGGYPYLAMRVVEPEVSDWYLEWDILSGPGTWTGRAYGVSLCDGNIVELQALLYDRDLQIVDTQWPDGMPLGYATGTVLARSAVVRVVMATTPDAPYCAGA